MTPFLLVSRPSCGSSGLSTSLRVDDLAGHGGAGVDHDPRLRPAGDQGPDGPSGRRDQEAEPDQVGDDPRSHQDRPSHQDQDAVEEPRPDRRALRHVLVETAQSLEPLATSKRRASAA